MTHRLIVMRHAKSDWHAGAASDHARPLNARGRRDAPQIAKHLEERGWLPEAVYSSDSARTLETYERLCEGWGKKVRLVACPSLYLAGWDEVQRQLLAADPKEKTVMVLGHNPGWETMVSLLAGATDLRMTTANAALLTVEASDWQEALVLEGCWHLEALVRPKEI